MSAAFHIAAHHLRRIVRNPGLVLVLLAIPITLATIEYFAFGQTAASGKLPPIKVLFLDEDQTFVSGIVPQMFTGGPVKDMFETAPVSDRQAAEAMFRSNQASTLIVTPKGFQDAVIEGRRAELVVFKNPIQTFSPEVVESVLEITTVIVNGLYAQALDPMQRIRQMAEAGRQPSADEIAEISRGFFTAGQRLGRLQTLNDLQVAVERPGQEASTRIGPNPQDFFAFIFPGLAIFGLMFIGQALALRLLRDRVQGLPRRLSIAPISRASLLAGNMLYLIAGLFVMLVVLALIGRIVFQIPLREPGVLLVFGVGIAVFVTGLHLFVIGLARSDRGASAIGSGVVLMLSLLGGTMVPLEQYPPFLQRIALMTPNGPAQQGLVDVLVHKKGLMDVVGHLGTLWIWGLVLIAMAFVLERRTMNR